jgi:pimeloyl-ACP methyl ester carboxylesterase
VVQAVDEFPVASQGLSLRAVAWGRGEKIRLLAVHATSFCAEVWRPLWHCIDRAEPSAGRFFAFDQRGHGKSEAPEKPEAYAWPRLAEDVLCMLESVRTRGLAPDDALTLVGHSSGATAALAAAGTAPEAVRAIVAIEPVLFEPTPLGVNADSFLGSRAFAERSRRRRAHYASLEEARSFLAQRFPYAGFDPAALDAYLDGGFEHAGDGSLTLRCRPEVEAWCYEGAGALDLWPLARRIQVPVCLVLGEKSAVPPALLERLRSAAPVLDIVNIPAATHFAALERPAQVGRAVAAFAARLAAS